MMKIIITVFAIFILQIQTQCQEDIVSIESNFVLNNAVTASELINQFGEPDEKSKAEVWGADGLEHQTWYYKSIGLEIDFAADETKTQFVNSISISSPSDLKTSKGIGIGSTRKEVEKAYKKEIESKNKWGGPDIVLAGSEFGGVIFNIESGKVSSIFIGAAAE